MVSATNSVNKLKPVVTELETKRVSAKLADLNRLTKLTAQNLNTKTNIAKLAVALAHDLGAPLTAILINTQSLLHQAPGTCPALELQLIQTAASSAQEVLRAFNNQIKAINEQTEPAPAYIDIDSQIKTVLQLVSVLVPKSVTVSYNHIPLHSVKRNMLSSGKLCGAQAKLFQILFNLLTNAFEAFANLDATKPSRPKLVTIEYTQLGATHIIQISDTGCGIPKSTLVSVFDPFFTTKKDNIGIGLYVCKELVENDFKGKLRIKSTVGKGTVVKVILKDIV